MKSSIKIDLGANNEPVINIIHVDTDDLRDKFLNAFFKQLSYESNLAFIEFNGVGGNTDHYGNRNTYTNVSIHALKPDDLLWYSRIPQIQASHLIPACFSSLTYEQGVDVISKLNQILPTLISAKSGNSESPVERSVANQADKT